MKYILLFLLVSSTVFAQDVLETNSKQWYALTPKEKICIVEGFIQGTFCVAYMLRWAEVIDKATFIQITPGSSVVSKVTAAVDEFYKTYPEVPMYCVLFEVLKRKYYDYK